LNIPKNVGGKFTGQDHCNTQNTPSVVKLPTHTIALIEVNSHLIGRDEHGGVWKPPLERPDEYLVLEQRRR
jgi:hypothetical protein